MIAEGTPVETRAQDADFVAACSMTGLEGRLPLVWPAPPDVPPSPKKAYRSHYVYPGWEALKDSEAWDYLFDFEVVIYLVDFEPLRPVLAQLLGWISAKGQIPFDPISIFLLIGWQITNGWSRAKTLRQIKHPCHARLARCFGFEDGIFPTEGGVRYWLTTLGENAISDETVLLGDDEEEKLIEVAIQRLNQIIAQSVMLLWSKTASSAEKLGRRPSFAPTACFITPLRASAAPPFARPVTSPPPPTPLVLVRLRKRDARDVTATSSLVLRFVSTLPLGMPKPVSSGTPALTSPSTAPTDPPTTRRAQRAAKEFTATVVYRFRFLTPTVASASFC